MSESLPALKQAVLRQVIAQLEREYETLTRAALEAKGEATHAESKQEGKYDTRGLEASYLAHGQSKRAGEISETIGKLRALPAEFFDPAEAVKAGSLVGLAHDGAETWIFVLPYTGGITVHEGNRELSVVSTSSPIARELLGKSTGDEVVVKGRSYELSSLG